MYGENLNDVIPREIQIVINIKFLLPKITNFKCCHLIGPKFDDAIPREIQIVIYIGTLYYFIHWTKTIIFSLISKIIIKEIR